MGSLGNNPSTSSWPPYQSYRDCSQGICSIYCPQWCYIMFPPPPPFHDPYPDSGTNFSPLIIAVIGILASAFLLVSYYTIVSKYCSRRPNNSQLTSTTPDLDSNQAQPINNHDQRLQLATSGLDEAVIKSIAICKYRKGDGFVDGTDCAVCLSEFQEHENLRLLPKCRHAFHPPCIDTWLRSHSNCPLCRSNVSPIPILTVPPETQPPTLVNISSLEFQRGSDSVLVVEETEGVASGEREEIAVSFAEHPFSQSQFQFKSGDQASVGGNGEVGVGEFPRSSSMGSFALGNSLSIADILSIDEDLQAKHGRIGIGSSSSREFESRTNMRRSISTGRFFTTSDHRGNSALILPN